MKLTICQSRHGSLQLRWEHTPASGARGIFHGNPGGLGPIGVSLALSGTFSQDVSRSGANSERALIIAFNDGDLSSVSFVGGA